MLTLLGAVTNSIPVSFEISAATLTSKPFLVLRPWNEYGELASVVEMLRTYSSDSSSALCEAAHTGKGGLNSGNTVSDLLNVATEFLPKGQRCGILNAP